MSEAIEIRAGMQSFKCLILYQSSWSGTQNINDNMTKLLPFLNVILKISLFKYIFVFFPFFRFIILFQNRKDIFAKKNKLKSFKRLI